MPTEVERWMTVPEVADHLRLSRAKVYEMAQDGQIPCTKLAGRWRFSRGEIDTWMLQVQRSQTQNPTCNRSEPLFRDACRYPHILDEGIVGNAEGTSLDALREAAWRLVAAYESDREGDLLGQYARALQSGRASHDLAEIAKAVTHGRVRVLLHEAGENIWGHVDPDTGEAAVHEKQEQQNTEDANIIDDLCELTLLKGGKVFEIAPNDLLRGSPIGAIYRY